MAWLGEELPATEQDGRTLAPHCLKDVMEERLFAKRRDLFSKLDLVFMDTTSEAPAGKRPGNVVPTRSRRSDYRSRSIAWMFVLSKMSVSFPFGRPIF